MNNKVIKYIFLTLAGVSSFIISLIKYILSYEIYKDEYGTDISFNNDYVIALLISLVLIIYGIHAILSIKNSVVYKNGYIYSGICISSLLSFYPLGVFFKALNKHKDLTNYYPYLFIGIVCMFIFVYFVIYLIENIKNKSN